MAEFRGVFRFRPSRRRAAASALAGAFALLFGLAAPVAQAQTSVTLVSNTGQSSDATSDFQSHRGQSFTTGGNAAGYKLTSVTFPVTGTGSLGSSGAVVRIESSGTDNKPGGSLGTLTLSQSGTTVTGTTMGIDLAANTTYFVVLTGTSSTATGIEYRRTNSDSEDAGAATGWSIGDGSLWGDSSLPSSSTTSWKIAIHGYAKGTGTPATPRSPASGEQQQVVKRAVAEVASRTVAGALDNIGTRMGDAAPAPGLSLAGERLPFSGSGTASPDGIWPSGGGHGRGVRPDELLGSSAFSWSLGAAEREKGFDPLAPRWAVWGRGDFGTFAGRPDDIASYSGETRTGWLGADARGTRGTGRWVAGLAVSRGSSRTDYVMDGERGRLETDLTAFWPYGRWTFPDGLEMQGLLGVGRGEARHQTGDGMEEKSDLSMWAASAGFSRPLPPMGGIGHGIDLAARGDASVAFMETGHGDEAVDGLSVDVARVRGGVEVAGGMRYAGARVAVEVRGRWLAAHTEAGAKERGVSLTARLDPGALGRGLSASLAPRWGAGTGGPLGGTSALWRDEMPRGGSRDSAGGFEGELGYGFGLNGGRFTGTPNLGFGASDGGGRNYRIGWRLTPAVPGYAGFRVDLDATRRESANASEPPGHGAMLTGAIRW